MIHRSSIGGTQAEGIIRKVSTRRAGTNESDSSDNEGLDSTNFQGFLDNDDGEIYQPESGSLSELHS